MSSSNDNDEQQRFALGFLFALIALVVSTVVGVVVYKRAIQPARAPVAAAVVATPEAVILPVIDVASIKLENGIVKFYFATGKADVAAGAKEALADVANGVASGKKALVSGYHDATGDQAVNEELAKQRAISVRVVLVTLGVPEDKVELKKPEALQGTGDNAEARRVEVILID